MKNRRVVAATVAEVREYYNLIGSNQTAHMPAHTMFYAHLHQFKLYSN